MEPSFPPPPYSAYDGDHKPLQDAYSYGYPGIPSALPPTTIHGQSMPMQPSQQQPIQQQQQVVVVANPASVAPFYNPYPVPMTGAIVLSCIVFWCFGWLLGGIAFILAVMGSDSSTRGDVTGALRLRNASYGVSVFGIAVGIIVLAVVIWFYSSCSGGSHSNNSLCN